MNANAAKRALPSAPALTAEPQVTPKLKPKPRLRLTVQAVSRAALLPSPYQLRKWLKAALTRDAEITVRIVDASEGKRLNRDYRGKDYATNVLTFVYNNQRGAPLSGDLVLCAGVVATEAKAQAKPLRHHYAHLTVHAALHLAGYDHENDTDATLMERKEIRILATLRIPNPYQEAAE